MKLHLDKSFKQSDQPPPTGGRSQARQFFSVGEPVFVISDCYDRRKNAWRYKDTGPYQIISIKRSKVALRDLCDPFRNPKFEFLENLQKIQSGDSSYGIQCSEFEWELIQNNSLSVKQLRK